MRLQKKRNDFQPASSWENKSDNFTDTHKDNAILEFPGNCPENQEKLRFLSTEIPFTLWSGEIAMILMLPLLSQKTTSEQGRTLQLHEFLITSCHSFKLQSAVFANSKFSRARRK